MALKLFKKKIPVVLLLLCLTFSTAGCVYIVVGSLGALGGYVVSPDTVEGIITGKEYNEVWQSAKDVISYMGIIEERNDGGGIIIAKINGARVHVTVLRMNMSTIKLNVKARKTWLPKIKVAQDVYIKIVNNLDDASSIQEY